MTSREIKVYVKSNKGVEFVDVVVESPASASESANCDEGENAQHSGHRSLPSSLVFEGHTRDKLTLTGQMHLRGDLSNWNVRVVELESQTGKIFGFVKFLCQSSKAALASVSNAANVMSVLCALLPSKEKLKCAVYSRPFEFNAFAGPDPPLSPFVNEKLSEDEREILSQSMHKLALRKTQQDVVVKRKSASALKVPESDQDDSQNGNSIGTKRQRLTFLVGEDERVRRQNLVKDVPLFSLFHENRFNDCMLFRDGDGPRAGACYFPDARRRYEFRCGSRGLEILTAMSDRLAELLKINLNRINDVLPKEEQERKLNEGLELYVQKPSLFKHKASDHESKAVTWTKEQYEHLGLQHQYLRYKSYQRFPETFNLCQRAVLLDDHARAVLLKKSAEGALRVVSIGGGPGFELDAIREFVWREHRNTLGDTSRFELYSIDIQYAWKPIPEALGFKFVAPFDINEASKDDLLDACDGRPVDVLIISYLLIYANLPRTAKLFNDLLRGNICKLILISERGEKQELVPLLVKENLKVTALMPQKPKDERQLLVQLEENSRPTDQTSADVEDDLLFPNVPFAKGT